MNEIIQHDERKYVDFPDVITICVMCVGSFLIETTLGLAILPLISIPLMGGLVSGFFDAGLIFIAIYLVPRRGAAFLFAVLLLSLSTVTPSFGPVGLYKIWIGVGLGLTSEMILMISRRPIAIMLAIAIAFALSIPVTYFAWVTYGIPGAEELRPALVWLAGIYAVLGFVGSAAGYAIFKNFLIKHRVVVRIRSGVKDSAGDE